ncbi:MAG: hypothetical protein AAF607_14400 [Pseudomonadota bacterium]
MKIYTLIGLLAGYWLLAAPGSLARYNPAAIPITASTASQLQPLPKSVQHLLDIAVAMPRPQHMLAVGAPVRERGGAKVGEIEGVVVRYGLVQAILTIANPSLVQPVAMGGAEARPMRLFVPSTAFERLDGSLVLTIPTRNLIHMEEAAP